MKLSDFPTQRRVGRVSHVDLLPPDVVQQLIEARQAGTHSVGAMIEWLKSEGHDTVTAAMLSCWFQSRGYRHGAGRGDA